MALSREAPKRIGPAGYVDFAYFCGWVGPISRGLLWAEREMPGGGRVIPAQRLHQSLHWRLPPTHPKATTTHLPHPILRQKNLKPHRRPPHSRIRPQASLSSSISPNPRPRELSVSV